MRRVTAAAGLLVLAGAVSGCTDEAPSVVAARHPLGAAGRAVGAEPGSDVGNGRPQVSYDGLMVRRRVALALHAGSDEELAELRGGLDEAAKRLHTRLSEMSSSVLDPALLEQRSPDLTLLLPAGASLADARILVRLAASTANIRDPRWCDVTAVLVHDLRFSVHSKTPAAVAAAIAREGILSDALGNYLVTFGSAELDVSYTGPLLSDRLVYAVRDGMARSAGVQPAAVSVSPRSTAGVGVDLAKEPAPPAVVSRPRPSHTH